MLSTVIVSCGDEMKKSSLDELNNQKSTLVAKIDSLNKELKSIEKLLADELKESVKLAKEVCETRIAPSFANVRSRIRGIARG